MTKTLLTASILALCAGTAGAQVKIALDSPPDLEGSGSYVWAHAFSTYLNEHGMAAEEGAGTEIADRPGTLILAPGRTARFRWSVTIE